MTLLEWKTFCAITVQCYGWTRCASLDGIRRGEGNYMLRDGKELTVFLPNMGGEEERPHYALCDLLRNVPVETLQECVQTLRISERISQEILKRLIGE